MKQAIKSHQVTGKGNEFLQIKLVETVIDGEVVEYVTYLYNSNDKAYYQGHYFPVNHFGSPEVAKQVADQDYHARCRNTGY